MNKLMLIGRLTKDPEERFTNTGKRVAQFTLAVDRGPVKTDFIQCVAWEKTAEIAINYLQKGVQCHVEGELNIDEHEGKYYTKCNVRRIELLGSRKNSEPDKPTETAPGDFPVITDDEVPF